MPSTIEQIKQAILKRGGKASKHQIARELKISLDYASLILGELKRKGEIVFSDGFYVLISAKKDVIQDKEPEKPAVPSKRINRRSKRPKGEKKTKKPRIKKHVPHPLSSILGISGLLAQTLEKAGYATIESIAKAPINKLMADAKLKLSVAARLINQARKTK
jgi:predicted flap endonuclease-1-like 5' DNA nuclease